MMYSTNPARLLMALAASTLTAAAAHGALVAADNFESYPAGVQFETSAGVQLNGGSGFTAPYNANDSFRWAATVANTGLTYSAGALNIDGGDRALQITGNESIVDKLIARPFTPQSGPVYFSFLYRTNNPLGAEDFIQIGFSNAEDGEPKISVGTGGGTSTPPFFIRIPTGTGGNLASTTLLQPDLTYLLVGKIGKSIVGGNYDQLTLYLNPTTDTEPATPLLSKTGASGIPSVSHFIVRTARMETTDIYLVDELRIGTTYAAVVPEPASAAVLSIAAGFLLMRRRSVGTRRSEFTR